MSKIKTILLMLFVGTVNFLYCQNPTIKDTNLMQNHFTIDADVISASFTYKRKIANKLSLGFSFGVGLSKRPVLNSIFIGDYELLSIGIPLQYQVVKLIYIDIVPRYALLADDKSNTENTIGIGTGFFIGGKIIQYGFKTMFGRTTFSNPDYFISNSFLTLRFSIVYW